MQPAPALQAPAKQPSRTPRQQLFLLVAGLIYTMSFLAVAPLLVMAPWAALGLGAVLVYAQFTRLRAPSVLRVMSFIFGYGLCAVGVYAALAEILG
jgi:hypothetical protein